MTLDQVNVAVAWLKSKNVTAHSIAVTALFIASAVASDQKVRDFVLSMFLTHPKFGSWLVSLAVIIASYKHSSSPAGAVAEAQAVMASPVAPTQRQVDAVKIDKVAASDVKK